MPGDDTQGALEACRSNAYRTALTPRVGALPEQARADALDAQ